MAGDFHTHFGRAIPALVSAAAPDAAPVVSLECHPWKLPEQFSELGDDFFARLQLCAALGEIGLDRLRGPELAVQQQFLVHLLDFAQETGKPVVFHVVRAFPELFQCLKRYSVRRMIHGFRGRVALLDELWARGFTVSFHHSILRNEELLAKLRKPAGPFGFESDDDESCDVRQIIAEAEILSGNRALEKLSDAAWEEFING